MSDERMERLAKLEAKFDIFMSLLQEIRDDVKDHPTRSEIEALKAEHRVEITDMKADIDELKKGYWKMFGKLSILGIIASAAMAAMFKYLAS